MPGSSLGMVCFWARAPCLMAFREEARFPSSGVGPRDRRPFVREISARCSAVNGMGVVSSVPVSIGAIDAPDDTIVGDPAIEHTKWTERWAGGARRTDYPGGIG